MYTNPIAASRQYRPDIDCLRGAAILGVVLYHAGVPLLSGGYSGVDIFFVISGYLIGGHIYADLLRGCFSFLEFYRLRAKRILPAYFTVLLVTVLAAMVLLSPLEAERFGKSSFAATLSASNIFFWKHSDYFDTQNQLNPMLMTWSLGVEEQFYAVIPMLMVLMFRIRRSLMLPATLAVCGLSFLVACTQIGNHPTGVFYLLPTRAWELGAGVALAMMELGTRRRALPARVAVWMGMVGILIVLLPMFLLNASSTFPGATALPSVVGAALLIATGGSWMNRRLLAAKPLVFVGRISYSLYLWHWPILALLRTLYAGKLPAYAAASGVIVAFAAAVASYFFIEQPFRRSTLPPLPLLARYGLALLAALAVCGAITASHGFPGRYPQLSQMERVGKTLQENPCLLHKGEEKLNLSEACYETPADRPTVVIWGDSHAAALVPGLREIIHNAGYGFVQLTKGGCRPSSMDDRNEETDGSIMDDCARFNNAAVARMQADNRIKIVIIAAAWSHVSVQEVGVERKLLDTYPEAPIDIKIYRSVMNAMQKLGATIRSLQAGGKQVIVMEDYPSFNIDPLLLVRTRAIPIRHAIAMWMGADSGDGDGWLMPQYSTAEEMSETLLRGMILNLPGVIGRNLRNEFCDPAGRCQYRAGKSLLYIDNQHLSKEGAEYALRNFEIQRPERN